MPNLLTDLQVKEVSLVDRPANAETDPLTGAKVARARVALYKRDSANPDKSPDDMPEAQNKGDSMTLQEIEAKITAQDGLIATMKADTDVHKAQTEEVLKMSDKERKAFGSMSADKRKEYMAADATKRKAMCKEFGKPEDEADDGGSDGSAKKIEKAEREFKAAREADTARIAKLEADNLAIKKAQRLEHFSAMAEAELPHTAGSRVAKGENLMLLADTLPNGETGERFKEMVSTMKAADKLIGDKMKEVGKWGGGVSMGSKTELENKVQDIMKRDKVDEGHAWIKASEEAPDLFRKYEAEQRAYKPAA